MYVSELHADVNGRMMRSTLHEVEYIGGYFLFKPLIYDLVCSRESPTFTKSVRFVQMCLYKDCLCLNTIRRLEYLVNLVLWLRYRCLFGCTCANHISHEHVACCVCV